MAGMPSWLLQLLLGVLAKNLTPEVLKGFEAELVCLLEGALKGHPAAEKIVEAATAALGIAPCPLTAA